MISVDTIYQRVLALANKEQRGYITPQEFNLYANQAQMEIFEQYFYDLNQFKRAPGNDSEDHNMINVIEEKLYLFRKSSQVSSGTSVSTLGAYKLGNVYKLQEDYDPTSPAPLNKSVVVEEVNQNDLIITQGSPLTRANHNRPIYYIQENIMYFIPETAVDGNYRAYYISAPTKVNWTYIVVDEKALYNPSAADHNNFELHISEEGKLVDKILQLAGIGIKDYNVAQFGAQKEMNKVQQQKQ